MKPSVDRVIGRSGDRPSKQGSGHDFSRPESGKKIWASAPEIIGRTIQTIRAVVCEIFDESAYERFLQRTTASPSVESYRAFMRERESAIARKPRCC